MKGWLDNYNEEKVTLPEGFVGQGYDTTGRNYSPAWGGQFKDGGTLNIPTIKDEGSFNKDGVWVPNWKAMAAQAKKLGAKKVKTDQGGVIYFNDKWEAVSADDSNNMAMGGSMPGAVGFTYARTNDPAPSNGPYAKKTMASAQDGTRIKTNVPVSIDELKKANASAEAFNKQYVQSPNYINLLQKQGYAPEEIKRRQDEVLGMTNDDYTYTNFGPNYVYADDSGKTKINYNQGGLGDWANFGDIAAHEWGHVGVTRFGEDALKPAEQYMLTSRLNMKNVSSNEEAAEHDMAPQENRADLVELRKALQDRGIYDSFKGGKFKQKHLNQLRKYKGDEDEYWNRSMRLYKDKDIVDLMNTIASNDPQQGMPTAQNGAEMKFYQNGLDFKPKSISKNGSKVIKDDMGQWAYPGEITEIGSNQITMQGVPYPVLGISDTGDTQMMYPNEDYTYQGSSVTEYPMMQDGGPVSFIGNTFNKAVNYVQDLFGEEKTKTINPYRDKQNIAPRKPDIYDAYQSTGELGNKEWTKFSKDFESGNVDTYKDDKNRIKLNTGRFTGANVPASMIDDLAASARRNNIPIGQMLTLVGRESTFGQQKSNMRSGAKNEYTSGWNVAEEYRPYDADRFLADQKVPGIKTVKTSSGWGYDVADEKAARAYVNAHPELLDQYKAKLAKTPKIGNQNSFDLAARYLKKKGVQGYNPGDPTYVGMFQKDYNTLKTDKNLMAYLKKKGYRYEDGGELTKLDQLTNFTNYNTKQPGGWLDKYQD